MSKSWFLVLSLAVAFTGPARAHMGDRVFQIWELPTANLPDLHDNTLDDWEENFPGIPLDYHDFVNVTDRPEDPEDLAFRIFLAWHDASQSLYIAFECLDNQFSELDGLTVSVDGDHSGGLYRYSGDEYSEEEQKRLNQSQAQNYWILWGYSPKGIRLYHFGAAESWVTRPPWGDADGFQIGEAPNHAVVELQITPWDDLDWAGPEQSRRSELKGGRIIGLDLTVMDIDESNQGDPPHLPVQNWYKLVPFSEDPTLNSVSASVFADAELVPCRVGDCSEAPGVSAVQPDTWGRIKASFR